MMIKYTIEIKSIDNQIRKYDFYSKEIGALGEVKDEIRIKQGNIYVLKRIGFTKEFLSYVLPEEELIKAEQTDKIKLFKGTNDVRVKDINGNYILEYYIDNPELELLATQGDLEESRSEISLLEGEASLRVNKESVITAINQSPETISINSDKIKLEGHTTINNGFSVDLDGNMQCRNANINNLVSKDGIQNYLAFKNLGGRVGYSGKLDIQPVGYEKEKKQGARSPLYIQYSIPKKFIIDKAFLIVRHLSVKWEHAFEGTLIGSLKEARIYHKNMENLSGNLRVDVRYPLGAPLRVIPELEKYIGNVVSGAWGNGITTYTFPEGATTIQTIDLSDIVSNNNIGMFAIAPRKDVSEILEEDFELLKYEAYMSATLYVFGYLNKE